MLSDQGLQDASEWLLNDEEFRQYVYDDETGKTPEMNLQGKLTIGIGFNLTTVGLSLNEALLILRLRIKALDADLTQNLTVYKELSEPRQIAMLNKAYNMGEAGLEQFHDMMLSLNGHDYLNASKACMDSLAAANDHYRYERISETLLTGKLPSIVQGAHPNEHNSK